MQNEQEISTVNGLVTDIKGAIALLEARGRLYSVKTLQYHVRQGNLPAYVFDDAAGIVRWDRDNPAHRGKEYIFLKSDLAAVPLDSKAGRRRKDDEERP